MAKELKIRITGDSSGLKAGTDEAEGVLKGFGGKVSAWSVATGTILADGIKTGVSAAVGFIGDAIGAATDYNETVSKVGVLFGDSAGEVEKFAEGSAVAFGQSKQDALDASATFATFGKAAGLSGQELADFSTGFVGLSSDMASFNNTSPEEAVEAIGAALRGESEPIRKYGVLLDDATLRQKAFELGIISSTKDALTPQQKVLAAQAAIYEQTSAAQGDFARTSDGLANQQRILGAQFENLKTTIGQAFLPMVLELVTAFNTKVMPVLLEFGPVVAEKVGGAIRSVVEWIQQLVATFQEGGWKAAFASVAEDLAKLWWDAQVFLWGTVYPAIGEALLAIGKAFGEWVVNTAVPYLQANLPIWLAEFGAWMDGTALPWLAEKAQELAVKLSEWVVDSAQQLLSNLPVWIGKFSSWFANEGFPTVVRIGVQLAGKFVEGMGDLTAEMIRFGAEVIQGLIDGMLSMAEDLASTAAGLAGKVTGAVSGALGISSPSKVMMEMGRQSAQGFALGLGGGAGMVSSAATSLARSAIPAYTPAELSGGMTVDSLGAPGMVWASANQAVVVQMDGREVGRGLVRPQQLNSRAAR